MTPGDGPIVYRGRAHRAPKAFWRGTQRSVSPAETLERIRPHFETFGITRLANLTGLDRIGIPVTLAIRPNADTLSQGAGKGFTLEAALVSGAMEAIELAHAEQTRLPRFREAYDRLPEPRVEVSDLALIRNSLFQTWWSYEWTMGWDLVHQCEVPLPVTSIDMGLRPTSVPEPTCFQVTSNGLASGNNFLEAVNAGLFEVIERDAIACHLIAWDKLKRPPPVVDLATVEHPLVLELMERLRAARVALLIFDCTVDTQVPVYMAYIHDSTAGTYRGNGAHLDPETAMIRAITEAIQARLVYIAGSRDDVPRSQYASVKRQSNWFERFSRSVVASIDARTAPCDATSTFEGDTGRALSRLNAAGIEQVIVVDLSQEALPVHVVKVVVPGFEGYMFDSFKPGRRARAFVQSKS